MASKVDQSVEDITDKGGEDLIEELADELHVRQREKKSDPYGGGNPYSGSREFTWHFTATWKDVQAKAKRIRGDGHVRVISESPSYLVGEVRGDTNIYQTTLAREPGTKRVAMWECGCAWASYSWGRSGRWKKYEGRMCSHALALNYEGQARGWGGQEITEDAHMPLWRSDPSITVKVPGDYKKPEIRNWRLDAALHVHEASTSKFLREAPAMGVARDLLIDGEAPHEVFATIKAMGAWNAPSILNALTDAAPLGPKEAVMASLGEEMGPGLPKGWFLQDVIRVRMSDPYVSMHHFLEGETKSECGRTSRASGRWTRPSAAVPCSVCDKKLTKREDAEHAELERQYEEKYGVKGIDTCKFCGSDWLFDAYFDDEGYAVTGTGFGGSPDEPGTTWRTICNNCGEFQEKARSKPKESVKTAQADTDGVMVALVPPADVLQAVAIEGGEPIDNLHVTVAYLGKIEEVHRANLESAVSFWSDRWNGLTGQLSGYGVFENDAERVLYASVDVPHLAEAYADLVEILGTYDIEISSDHGLDPHLTLAYGEFTQPESLPEGAKESFDFDDATMAYGGEWMDIPFGVTAQKVTASKCEFRGLIHWTSEVPEKDAWGGVHLRPLCGQKSKTIYPAPAGEAVAVTCQKCLAIRSEAKKRAELKDDPEPALPETTAEDDEAEIEPDIEDAQDRSWIMAGSGKGGGQYSNGDIAQAAEAFLSKQSLKDFTPAEQRILIDEGEAEGVVASNLDRLDITDTHYEGLEQAYQEMESSEEDWLY